jgi:hypothetical protein
MNLVTLWDERLARGLDADAVAQARVLGFQVF